MSLDWTRLTDVRTRAGRRRAIPLAGAVVAAFCVLVGAFASTAGAAPSTPLTVNLEEQIQTIDPASACHLIDTGFTNAMYGELMQYSTKAGPNGTLEENDAKIVPYLAKSYSVNHSGTVYTFILHSGMKFPNGDPVDAAAFKYSIERPATIILK